MEDGGSQSETRFQRGGASLQRDVLESSRGGDPPSMAESLLQSSGEGESMVAKKSTSKRKSRKVSLKRETLKDLSVGSKAREVKGGSIIDCATRKTQ